MSQHARDLVFVAGPTHMELASGAYLDLAAPEPVMTLADVAQGLANCCRYAGQTRTFYSVAEHAVHVACRLTELGAEAPVALAGLHHDDAEAFTGDITRPLKLAMPAFRPIEDRVFAAVVRALGLGALPFDDPRVKEADDWALAMEAHHLLPSQGRGWFCEGLYDPAIWTPHSEPWALHPVDAEYDWLDAHRQLSKLADGQHADSESES